MHYIYIKENAQGGLRSDQKYVHYHQRVILTLSSTMGLVCIDHFEIGKHDNLHIGSELLNYHTVMPQN